MTQPGRNQQCPCGSGAKYKRCCRDRDRESQRDAAGAAPAWGELTLLIETGSGLLARRIPNASPLSIDENQGQAAEDATHDAAATWGLPDFVYRPTIRKVGSGTRELGDGILMVGDLAAVIQVKSRAARSPDPEKERRWIDKQMAAASRQADGTIRQLGRESAEFVNARGRTIEIDGKQLTWMVVIVIDHPDVPDGIPAVSTSKSTNHTVILLRRDWEFLFNQLKSTHAVIEYLQRAPNEARELGREPMRYYELAAADARAEPEVLDDKLLGPMGRPVSAPLLPLEPAAADDRNAHLLVRSIFEDIATCPLDGDTERDRLRALSELDRLPVGQRTGLGRFIIGALAHVADPPEDETLWSLRSIRGPAGKAHLAFGACSRYSNDIRDAFSTWVQLKHHDVQQVTGEVESLISVGVLLTPRADGRRPVDTTMCAVAGDLKLTTEELAAYRNLWPTPH
jgi:hypothetical protein